MKNILTLIFLFLFPLTFLSGHNGPDVGNNLVQNINGSYTFYSGQVSSDADGTILYSGGFKGELIFKNDTLISEYYRSGFLGLCDSTNNWLWYKNLKGTGHNQVNSTLALEDGWLITGVFSDSLFLDDFQLVAQEYQNVFFAFINQHGQFTMAGKKALIPSGGTQVIKKDQAENLFFAGEFYCDFEINDSVYSAEKNRSVIISKISREGVFEDFKVISSQSSVELADMEVLPGGEILLGVGYADSLYFDEHKIGPKGEKDFIIARYNQELGLESFETSTGKGKKTLRDITFHQDGFVVFGEYTGEFLWHDNNLPQEPGQHIFLIKFDLTGSLIWEKTVTGYSRKNAGAVVSAEDDKLYLWADYRGKIILDNQELETEDFTYQGFMACISPTGEYEWVKLAENMENLHPGVFKSGEQGKILLFGTNRNSQQKAFDNVFQNGVYLVELFDCSYSKKPALPSDTIFCGSGLLDGGDYTAYLWNNSNEGRFFEVGESMLVTLEVSDKYGCVNHDTVYVEVLPEFEIQIAGEDKFCPGSSTFLSVNTDASVVWNTGATGNILSVNEEGEYSAVAVNKEGCKAETSKLVSLFEVIPPVLSDYYFVSPGEILELNPGSYQSYLWTGGYQEQILIIDGNDFEYGEYDYFLEVVDYNNCMISHDFLLQVYNNSTYGDESPGDESFAENKELVEEKHLSNNLCEFMVYPNPGKGPFYVKPVSEDLLNTENEIHLALKGSKGETFVYEKADQLSPIWLLENEGLAPGTYFLSILKDDKVCNTKKLIVTP